MIVAQLELLPDVVLQPTIAMQRGESFVTQCSWCGMLVCADRKVPLGDCPACSSSPTRPPAYVHHWWEQELPVGPFRSRLDTHPDLDLPAMLGEPEPLI